MPAVAQRCNFSQGDVVDGKFQVTRTLGEGSFGMVYAVRDKSGSTKALKLLKLWEVSPEIRDSLVARFDMEFETGRIESNYLVHSLSHGFAMGNPYIVMEFCSNGDLSNLISQGGVDLSKAATHVLCGLKALHGRGKVHRDLKPENVLVKANGDYALTDFGICGDRNKRMTERNILGNPKQIFGTYAYMPPEQLNPKKDATVLPTTDIFSFGVMMYQLITGCLPFGSLQDERDLVYYLRNGKEGKWDKKSLLNTAKGRDWERLISGCLVPDFHHRLQNVDAVLPLVPNAEIAMKQTIADVQDFQTRIVNGVLLRIMQGDDYGRVYYLDDMLHGNSSVLYLGRNDVGVSNDISINERSSCYISRRHCTLELDYEIGSWIIRDGQWDRSTTGYASWRPSTNGTFVNSNEVGTGGMPFAPGDIISVGDTKLRAEAY